MKVWRICKSRFATSAFSGEGAYLYQGRWNPAGVRMVYTSTSLALASVEFFVHLDPSMAPEDLVSTSATLPAGNTTLTRVEIAQLPADWRSTDQPVLQKIGADWIGAGASVALEVPSIAIEGEWNVLLNPSHPEFAKVTLDPPKPFHFDQRLFQRIR